MFTELKDTIFYILSIWQIIQRETSLHGTILPTRIYIITFNLNTVIVTTIFWMFIFKTFKGNTWIILPISDRNKDNIFRDTLIFKNIGIYYRFNFCITKIFILEMCIFHFLSHLIKKTKPFIVQKTLKYYTNLYITFIFLWLFHPSFWHNI